MINISDFFNQLDTFFRNGQISEVEPYILNQLMVANQQHDKQASLAMLNELNGFYRAQERYEESIRVAEQALALCRAEYILGTIPHATSLLNAATSYRFAGQVQKALELFAEAEKIYEEKLPINDEHYAGLFNNMSAAYAEIGNTDKAAEYLLRAAAIMDAQPNRVIESAVTHANLAALYFKMQNYYGAKREIATACSIIQNRPEYAGQYQQFQNMQQMFAKYPD